MSNLDQLLASIEARIAELNNEMSALEAARAALVDDVDLGVAALSTKRAGERTGPRPQTANGRGRAARAATARSEDGAARHAVTVASEASTSSTKPQPKPPTRARARTARSQRPAEVLLAGKLEVMLRQAEDGLSAITISKRANASYTQVRDLLRELEVAGQIRRTGTRRSTLWRLITDEERIAARTAELERISLSKSKSSS
jgi:hypothetical protein